MSRPRLIALLLALVTLLVYGPVLRCDFVNYDDDDYVTNNPHVNTGLSLANAVWAFRTYYADNWHPLTWLSHMAVCQVFGLNPRAHHLVNVLFHAANTALLFALLYRLTAKIWPSALVAALFAWHPLHVESVAWVAELKDVQSTFFGLLVLLSYVQFTRRGVRRDYVLAVAFYALALLSKPMLVTLPFVMLLLDYWPLQRLGAGHATSIRPDATTGAHTHSLWQLVAEKWPFFALAAAVCLITFLAQSSAFHNSAAVTSLNSVPLSSRVENALVAYAMYLMKLLYPVKLAVLYPLKSIPGTRAITAALLLAIATRFCWLQSHARPYLYIGWLWFLGTLAPVIGLVQVGAASMADRYTYLPSIGIFIMAGFLAAEFVAGRPGLTKWAAAAAALVLIIFIGVTERQLTFWRNSETLFRHSLAVTADNPIARLDLGYALQARGDLTGALAEYRASEALRPSFPLVHCNLANTLDLLGRPAESLAEYRQAIQLLPGDPSLRNAAGYELGQLGQFDAALKEFDQAAQTAPFDPAPHVNAAEVYYKMGRDNDGRKEFGLALGIAPDDWRVLTETAYFLAANDQAASRDGATALGLAARANLLTGGHVANIFDVLGIAYAENGDFVNAVESAQRAIELATATKSMDIALLRRRLELYQNSQPWHESFLFSAPATNHVSAPVR